MNNEKELDKQKLLTEIEELISYGRKDPTINPELLKYLEIADLKNIKAKLLQKNNTLSQEDKDWLEQFKKYD